MGANDTAGALAEFFKSVFSVTMLKGEDKNSILEVHIERLASAFEKSAGMGSKHQRGNAKSWAREAGI